MEKKYRTEIIVLPEEYDNEEYEVLMKGFRRKQWKFIEKMQEEGPTLELIDEVLPNWVVNPKITVEDLNDDDCDVDKMLFLTVQIINKISMTADKMANLQKKVKWQSV